MSELLAFIGGTLAMAGGIILLTRRIYNGIVLNAKEFYDRLGQRKFLFINYGKIIQYKIRQFYEQFGKEVFEKETPAEKEAAVKPYVERDFQKRKREARKQNRNL